MPAMQRQVPTVEDDAIALYIRTYYSLLRSSSSVRVRTLEEAHIGMGSSLHPGAAGPALDLGALIYASVRLPACACQLKHVILGQSRDQFARAGHPDIATWPRVRTLARRRRWQWNQADTLAVYVVSASDIDDLIPILVAYQLEWNKLHDALALRPELQARLAALGGDLDAGLAADLAADLASVLGVMPDELARLATALGCAGLAACAGRRLDLSVMLLAGSFVNYQRAASRWWRAVGGAGPGGAQLGERPVYFVSSNMHALSNLLGGYARTHAAELAAWVEAEDPEGLASEQRRMVAAGDQAGIDNLYYYLLRLYARDPERRKAISAADLAVGIRTVPSPEEIEVDAQIIPLAQVDPARCDARLRLPGLERLAKSDALVLNIDYPLGMAAYHMLARVLIEVPGLCGAYIMGKAATLNARVGDIMLSDVVHDEHSLDTFLIKNDLTAAQLTPYLRHGSALDHQKAITVKSAFLQNRALMDVFYTEGYTVLEMESGPYLAAVTEAQSPRRHPVNELINLGTPPFPIGLVHYASDTPFSRHKQLLSKSMSFFGMDATYACAVAITRRIFELELARLG
jgi:hypothetical protein